MHETHELFQLIDSQTFWHLKSSLPKTCQKWLEEGWWRKAHRLSPLFHSVFMCLNVAFASLMSKGLRSMLWFWTKFVRVTQSTLRAISVPFGVWSREMWQVISNYIPCQNWKIDLSHAHKTTLWALRVPFQISDKHFCQFYMRAPPPRGKISAAFLSLYTAWHQVICFDWFQKPFSVMSS